MSGVGTIDYEALTQRAMLGVVRTVLEDAAKYGLPGDHHFYISFDTLASGVVLSKRLREKYAEEMTIVLQHRFWDLVVSNDRFEVKLTFDGIPERLVIPFKSIKVFFDPSVRYGLQFEAVDMSQIEQANHPLGVDSGDGPADGRDDHSVFEPDHATPEIPRTRKPDDGGVVDTSPKVVAAAEPGLPAVRNEDDGNEAPDDDQADGGSAEIVNLDAFRKKQ